MTAFRTRFNYLYFSFVLLGFLLFIAITIFFFFWGFPFILHNDKGNAAMYVGIACGVFGMPYMVYYCGGILHGYRYILLFEDDAIIQKDAIFRKTREIDYRFIEGYTIGYYIGTQSLQIIEIHLKNGDEIKLLNYMNWNYKEIKPVLVEHGILPIIS